jgi:hypothetical protein
MTGLRTPADTDVRAPIPTAPGTDLIHHHCSISLDQEPTGFSGALIFHQKKPKFSAERNNSETSRLALEQGAERLNTIHEPTRNHHEE